MKQTDFAHEFVDAMPEDLEEGRLYVSIRFRTAAHLCACGCGSRVVTPIKPAKWQLSFDGETISLSPSIGRWQLPCKSHYWIRCNKIVWSRAFTGKEIDAVARRDSSALRRYYDGRTAEPAEVTVACDGMWARLWAWIKSQYVGEFAKWADGSGAQNRRAGRHCLLLTGRSLVVASVSWSTRRSL